MIRILPSVSPIVRFASWPCPIGPRLRHPASALQLFAPLRSPGYDYNYNILKKDKSDFCRVLSPFLAKVGSRRSAAVVVACRAESGKSVGGESSRGGVAESASSTLGAAAGAKGEAHHEGLRWYDSDGLRLGESGVAGSENDKNSEPGASAELVVSTMADFFNLEKQFSFYGAYHSNKVNILIHVFFVWPIYYTSLILWAYAAPLAPLPLPGGTLPLQEYMVLNWSFVIAALYSLYYVALDKKAGSLGAALCLGCWIGANAVAQALPWSVSWKIVLAAQVTCWAAQIFGHQKFEGRAPALLDNLPQAFIMAPFFVLLEFLQTFFAYEPYPGFRKTVEKNVDDAIRKFRVSKGKKAA